MDWWQAILLGLVQGLTEFLPVSSSGHLVIFQHILGASDAEGFLDFTVTVHLATVLSTIVVFRKQILTLLKGLFRFSYNDETDYICKILVSCIPVGIVGFCFKDNIEALFGEGVGIVGLFLLVTAVLLLLSDYFGGRAPKTAAEQSDGHRNGISYIQALIVGIGQACAVAPGLSRSGTTIATGLLCGVRRGIMAQFSFLMVLIPIVGEQMLDALKLFSAEAAEAAPESVGALALVLGFAAAFASGLFACKAMIALVRKCKMKWFALYCAIAGIVALILSF